MASKVLKVKLWDGEDGKKWKCNVSDIEGEILCGAFLLVHVHSRLLVSRHANHHGAIEGSVFFLNPCPKTNVCILSLQSHNSLSSRRQRRETSPISIRRLRRPRARSYTTASLARSAPFTARTVSRTASSVQ